MKPEIAIIVARASDHGIGCSEGLPWHMPEELKYFKSRTVGKPVIMGRRTFQSLGKPLVNRENIVLTSQRDLSFDGVVVKHNLDDAIEHALNVAEESGQDEIMIIGGVQIFKQAIKHAQIVYLTQIKHKDFKDTNAYLPDDYLKGWETTEKKSQTLHDKKSNLDIECDFKILRRSA